MIDARANFKLCELNSFYQRQWWVTGAQLEGPDMTCAHLCLHAFHALWTSTHCKKFDNDELLINDRPESRVAGSWRLSCLQQWYRCHRGRPDVMSSSWIEQAILSESFTRELDKQKPKKEKRGEKTASVFRWGPCYFVLSMLASCYMGGSVVVRSNTLVKTKISIRWIAMKFNTVSRGWILLTLMIPTNLTPLPFYLCGDISLPYHMDCHHIWHKHSCLSDAIT